MDAMAHTSIPRESVERIYEVFTVIEYGNAYEWEKLTLFQILITTNIPHHAQDLIPIHI